MTCQQHPLDPPTRMIPSTASLLATRKRITDQPMYTWTIFSQNAIPWMEGSILRDQSFKTSTGCRQAQEQWFAESPKSCPQASNVHYNRIIFFIAPTSQSNRAFIWMLHNTGYPEQTSEGQYVPASVCGLFSRSTASCPPFPSVSRMRLVSPFIH